MKHFKQGDGEVRELKPADFNKVHGINVYPAEAITEGLTDPFEAHAIEIDPANVTITFTFVRPSRRAARRDHRRKGKRGRR